MDSLDPDTQRGVLKRWLLLWGAADWEKVPAADLRSEVNSELNFSPNFEGLVLGCIDADFCK